MYTDGEAEGRLTVFANVKCRVSLDHEFFG